MKTAALVAVAFAAAAAAAPGSDYGQTDSAPATSATKKTTGYPTQAPSPNVPAGDKTTPVKIPAVSTDKTSTKLPTARKQCTPKKKVECSACASTNGTTTGAGSTQGNAGAGDYGSQKAKKPLSTTTTKPTEGGGGGGAQVAAAASGSKPASPSDGYITGNALDSSSGSAVTAGKGTVIVGLVGALAVIAL